MSGRGARSSVILDPSWRRLFGAGRGARSSSSRALRSRLPRRPRRLADPGCLTVDRFRTRPGRDTAAVDRVGVRPGIRRLAAPRWPLCRSLRPQARACVGPRRAHRRVRARYRRQRRDAARRRSFREGGQRSVHGTGRALAPHVVVRGGHPAQQGARRLYRRGCVRVHVRPRRRWPADRTQLALHVRDRCPGRSRPAGRGLACPAR